MQPIHTTNGITLMTALFATVCGGADGKIYKLTGTEDLVALAAGGKHDDQAIRLWRKGQTIAVGFYTTMTDARMENHETYAFLTLEMTCINTAEFDFKLGRLFRLHFQDKLGPLGLLGLCAACKNRMDDIVEFLGLLDGLGCQYLWQKDLDDGWREQPPQRRTAQPLRAD